MSSEPTWVISMARKHDVQDLIGLRREAERWLEAAGIDQWTPKWRDVADKKAERAIRQNRAWIVKTRGGVTVATVTPGGPDEDLWHPQSGPGLYMYKLIVARAAAGQGLGAALMDWCASRAAEWGYEWLRLDCWPSNPRLLDYYRANGWEDVRTVHAPGRDTGALMQRPARVTPTPCLIDEETSEAAV